MRPLSMNFKYRVDVSKSVLFLRQFSSCNDMWMFYGSFTLMETNPGMDSDSDSKLDGFIVLYRTFHIAQTWTQIPTLYFYV